MSAGISPGEKERLKRRHCMIFREMKSPLPIPTGLRARVALAAACVFSSAACVSHSRESLHMIGYGRLLLSVLDTAHFRWELQVGTLVMKTFKRTTNNDSGRSPGFLLLCRLLLLWTVVGSLMFAMVFLTS